MSAPPYYTRGQVERAQLALRRDGFYHGRIDGRIGPETRQALAIFQSQNGSPVTASLSPATMTRLGIGRPVSQGSSYPKAGMPSHAGR
jgi:peptidoglycan hydrolase-like protein with peptidoglycan-binding domain